MLISTLRGLIVSLVCSHQGGTLHIQVCGVTLCPSHALSGNDRYNPYPSAFIQYLMAMKEQLGVPPEPKMYGVQLLVITNRQPRSFKDEEEKTCKLQLSMKLE